MVVVGRGRLCLCLLADLYLAGAGDFNEFILWCWAWKPVKIFVKNSYFYQPKYFSFALFLSMAMRVHMAKSVVDPEPFTLADPDLDSTTNGMTKVIPDTI